jgi:uncharacterized protein YkwD
MLNALPVRRAAWSLLTTGAIAARLIAAPDGTGMPPAAASRACAYQHARAGHAPVPELRSAVVCLINHVRRRWHLPSLHEQRQLNLAAQRLSDQMVADDFFSHVSLGGALPWTRVSQAGFPWAAVGEDLATGFATPLRTVRAWLGSPDHCQILLSPAYRDVGIGVDRHAVRGFGTGSGTWTADFALARGSGPPSSNWGPASGCPY